MISEKEFRERIKMERERKAGIHPWDGDYGGISYEPPFEIEIYIGRDGRTKARKKYLYIPETGEKEYENN
jgi:hypothetical protein